MTTFGPRKSSDFSWLALSAAAFIAASPYVAKDVVVHAGTLLDGLSDSPRHQVSIMKGGIVYRLDGAPTAARVN
jgi:hypothetical protein